MGLLKHDQKYIRRVQRNAGDSKCLRAQYAALIIDQYGQPVSDGYNGKPMGSCNDDVCYRQGLPPSAAKDNCCLHAEVNCLLFSDPVRRRGGTMYVSGVPCSDCALIIMQSGMARLVYLDSAIGMGHRLINTEEVWTRYGSTVERVGYTDEAWEALYGETGIPHD